VFELADDWGVVITGFYLIHIVKYIR
jgi:hypothetical protein